MGPMRSRHVTMVTAADDIQKYPTMYTKPKSNARPGKDRITGNQPVPDGGLTESGSFTSLSKRAAIEPALLSSKVGGPVTPREAASWLARAMAVAAGFEVAAC